MSRSLYPWMKKSSFHRTVTSVAFTLSSLLGLVSAQEQQLSDADRVAILEKLEEIEGVSNDRVSGLYLRAISSYRAAIQSDTETMKLYLSCYEKVNFTDKNLKTLNFREWKKKNDERLGSKSFRLALRYQLAWLLLSIETASKDGDVTEMGNQAVSHLNQVFENAEGLKEHNRILKQNVLSSVFAKAYELNIKIENWPKSGLDIENIYEKLVMPQLRSSDKISELRAAWNKKILHTGTAIEAWTVNKGTTIGSKDALQTPEMKTFLSESRPQLLWNMEKDCFESGDERTAALNMLSHLETYVTHKDAPKWIEEFQGYISPPEAEVTDVDPLNSSN